MSLFYFITYVFDKKKNTVFISTPVRNRLTRGIGLRFIFVEESVFKYEKKSMIKYGIENENNRAYKYSKS